MIASLLLAAAVSTTPKPCTNVKNPPLCRELLDIYDRHELARAKTTKAAEAKKIDAANLARLEAILNSFGWPGRNLVGDRASAAAWSVRHNADLATQKTYFDTMKAAADAKELSPRLIAATMDRMAVRQGQPQTYGTEPNAPIDDEEHVDDRRAKVGLPALKKP